jgi:hypothetical protein
MSLGMAVALGYCAAFGTLAPPIYKGEFAEKMLHTHSGWVILAGVAVCLVGIAVTGLAGMAKENDMPEEQKKAAIKEFSFKKGILVATFSGVLSASFSYGLDRGETIKRITLRQALSSAARADGLTIRTSTGEQAGIAALERIKDPDLSKTVKDIDVSLGKIKDGDPALKKSLKDYKQVILGIADAGGNPKKYLDKYGLWQGLPVLVVVLLGGFTTNFLWCFLLNVKNKTGHQYFSSTVRDHSPDREHETIIETAIDAPSEEVVEHIPRAKRESATVPLLLNYLFCALAGTTWYMQFFFYSMGETQMGKYGFSSWTLHMASIIIFSTLWGIALHEWKGSSRRTIALVTLGLAILIGSTIIVGYGNYLGTLSNS